MTARKQTILINTGKTALVGLFALMMIAALHPEVRSQMRGSMLQDYREIVSTVDGDLLGNGSHYKVAKVKTRETLLLEIFEVLPDGSQKLAERIVLPDHRDGYFKFKNQATNLAIDDVDGSGHPAILVPTFDNNLVGRLNVYTFNTESGATQKIMRN